MTAFPKVVLARADGSAKLGMGNVTRMLAVTSRFAARGSRVIAIARTHDDRLRRRIEEAGCEYVGLDPAATAADDARLCKEVSTGRGVELAVVDLSNTDETRDLEGYATLLAEIAALAPSVVIDDLTRARFPRAVVVNPASDAGPDDYDRRFAPRLLLGPAYAILASDYAAAGAREHAGPVRRAVVALGGGVVARDLLRPVLAGLVAAGGAELEIDLLAGMEDKTALQEAGVLPRSNDVRVHTNLPSIAPLLRAADIAVVSGGVSKYEAAACGTPTVTVATVPHQVPWATTFAATGASLHAGGPEGLGADAVAKACSALLDPAVRRAMSARAQSVVDGRGVERVIEASLALLGEPSTVAR